MNTELTNVSQMESKSGDLIFSDIKWFADALKISINELESLFKLYSSYQHIIYYQLFNQIRLTNFQPY